MNNNISTNDIVAAFATTGIVPVQGQFVRVQDNALCGCALTALILAESPELAALPLPPIWISDDWSAADVFAKVIAVAITTRFTPGGVMSAVWQDSPVALGVAHGFDGTPFDSGAFDSEQDQDAYREAYMAAEQAVMVLVPQ